MQTTIAIKAKCSPLMHRYCISLPAMKKAAKKRINQPGADWYSLYGHEQEMILPFITSAYIIGENNGWLHFNTIFFKTLPYSLEFKITVDSAKKICTDLNIKLIHQHS